MEITIKLTYDGALLDKLTEIIKAENGNNKPVRNNQISKLYKELAQETIDLHFDKVLQIKKQSVANFNSDTLEKIEVPTV